MNFDSNTIKILSNFSKINQSILFKPGKTISTMAASRSIFAKADVDIEFDKKFAIYELNKFLSALSLFESPEIKVHDKHVEIRQGSKVIKYLLTEPEFIVSPPTDSIDLQDIAITFTITEQQYNEVIKAMSILALPEISIVCDGESILLKSINTKNPTSDEYSIWLGDTDKVFSKTFKVENIKNIPCDYEVTVTEGGVSHWKSGIVEYYIMANA